MIVTEEEARERRCPFGLVLMTLERERYNALVASGELQMSCVGSRCMFWRWSEFMPPESHGYCGVAGKPSGEP
ncbi:MAG: hypothetical protein NZM12_11945 [Steroidobacteraceae bacterium]|nr:hypothetical protein [Steroidobacteraceae bacterium]MDW8257810.1 hypothetical protein [Gammaproteobacteria bacterium]